jgi:hypothetical protein
MHPIAQRAHFGAGRVATMEGASAGGRGVEADGGRSGEQDAIRSAAPSSPPAMALAVCKLVEGRPHVADVETVAAAARQEEVERRRAILAAAGRDWGRADSAFTFRGHAGSAVPKAGEKRIDVGNEGPASAALHICGHAGSAADLTSLSGMTLNALWLDLMDHVRHASHFRSSTVSPS